MAKHEKLDHLGVSAFAESMAMMLHSGVDIDEALHLLGRTESDGVLAHALHQMAGLAEEGNSLGACMEKAEIFPEYAVRMVRAGERTGNLETVMTHLAGYYQNQKEISERLRSAIVYPAAMVCMIIIVLIIMLAIVLPVFGHVYASLSASSLGYIRFGYILCAVLLVIMAVFVVVMLAGLGMWRSGKKEAVEGALRKIPAFAGIFDGMGKYRFTSAYEIYLSTGETQDDAMLKSIELTDCAPVEEKLKRCLVSMEEGHGFAQAANDEELYEPIYGRMLLPAEKSGSVGAVLKRLTALLKEDVTAKVGRLVDTVEPLLSGVLMISIGLILLSLMVPLIGMMSSIG